MPEGRLEGDLRREEEGVRAACRGFQDAVFGVRVFNGTVWRPALKPVLKVPLEAGNNFLCGKRERAEKGEKQEKRFFHGRASGVDGL